MAGRRPARREREIREVVSILRAQGLRLRVVPTAAPGSATETAECSRAEGDDLVMACGGDGTINEVVNGLVPGPTPLAILPGGTANLIARELNLPLSPLLAARQLTTWRSRRLGLGLVTAAGLRSGAGSQMLRRYFLSVAGVGFDAYVIHRLSASLKLSLGVVGYALEAVRQALRYSFPRFVCYLEGREVQATLAVLQRTRYYAAWLRPSPQASVFDSQFSLCLFPSASRMRYFLYAAAVVARRPLRDMELLKTNQLVCTSQNHAPPIYLEVDGELSGQLPATFEIVPDALTVFAPAGSAVVSPA